MLVTHGLSFLPHADLILVMDDGQIVEAGSYTELLERRSSFADFLKIFSNTEHRENSSCRGQSSSETTEIQEAVYGIKRMIYAVMIHNISVYTVSLPLSLFIHIYIYIYGSYICGS